MTKNEIIASIDKAKERLNKAQDSVALTDVLNELSHLAWKLGLFEHHPDTKVDVCVFATAPEGSDKHEASRLAEGYRTLTHIKAWPTCAPNEIVIFPVDYADLIKVLGDLDEMGFSSRLESKDQ